MDMEGKLIHMDMDQQRATLGGDDGVITAAKRFMFTNYAVCP
jgi:hypothetical protein